MMYQRSGSNTCLNTHFKPLKHLFKAKQSGEGGGVITCPPLRLLEVTFKFPKKTYNEVKSAICLPYKCNLSLRRRKVPLLLRKTSERILKSTTPENKQAKSKNRLQILLADALAFLLERPISRKWGRSRCNLLVLSGGGWRNLVLLLEAAQTWNRDKHLLLHEGFKTKQRRTSAGDDVAPWKASSLDANNSSDEKTGNGTIERHMKASVTFLT